MQMQWMIAKRNKDETWILNAVDRGENPFTFPHAVIYRDPYGNLSEAYLYNEPYDDPPTEMMTAEEYESFPVFARRIAERLTDMCSGTSSSLILEWLDEYFKDSMGKKGDK